MTIIRHFSEQNLDEEPGPSPSRCSWGDVVGRIIHKIAVGDFTHPNKSFVSFMSTCNHAKENPIQMRSS